MDNKLDFMPYVLVFIKQRKAIIINFLFILIVAWVYAFYIAKKEYKAEIIFLPPVNENSFEGILPGGLSLPSLSSSEIMPEQISSIFSSKVFKRRVIEMFDLYTKYKLLKSKNKFVFAIKELDKNLALSVEESGSFTITKTIAMKLTAYHSSPDTVVQIANYSFSILDSTVRIISANRAARNRLFIEKQLNKNKNILDSVNKVMQDFQIQNKAYNIPEQAVMSINAYAQLKSVMLLNEIQMQTLKINFASETPELISLKKTQKVYQAKLDQLETQKSPSVLPSLQEATKLIPQYTNLLRDIEVQNQVILLLTREFEQAKIKEDKNISSLYIIDPAFVPEYKARPKRIIILLVWVSSYMLFFTSLLVFKEFFKLHISQSKFMIFSKNAWKTK